MGPPLGKRRQSCDAKGYANLTNDQKRKLKVFLDDRKSEKDAEKKRQQILGNKFDHKKQYRIYPSATPPTKNYPLWRFSCVGLVLKAYKIARIHLLSTKIPKISLQKLKELYPDFSDDLDNPELRQKLGLDDNDEWPVELVGYILHSLNRPVNEINGKNSSPYTPQKGDEYFSH